MNPLVNTLIIGSAKAGTTSLAAWLSDHPDCCVSTPKETMFFASPKLYGRGLDWYHTECFPHFQNESIALDATPAYSDRLRHPGVPEKVAAYNPSTRLIYMVRHPIRRIESAWKMYASNQPHHKDPVLNRNIEAAHQGFAEFLGHPGIWTDMVSTCRYRFQLEYWREHFPEDQIHLVFLEDLADSKPRELDRVCDFLGIDSSKFPEDSLDVQNSHAKRRDVTPFRHWVASSSLGTLAKTVVPRTILDSMANSPLGSRPIEIAKAQWTAELRDRFRDEVEADTQALLSEFGKPAHYYSFEFSDASISQ